MNFLDLVKERESVREYKDTIVPREMIELCLEASRLAPSACNSQPWRFLVIDDVVLKNEVAKKCTGLLPINRFVSSVPVIVVILLEPSIIPARLGGWLKDRPFNYIDLGIAAQHFCLQAQSLGLGTCILGWFDEDGICKILSIPKGKRIGLLITLGYPLEKGKSKKKRLSLSQIRSYNTYIEKGANE